MTAGLILVATTFFLAIVPSIPLQAKPYSGTVKVSAIKTSPNYFSGVRFRFESKFNVRTNKKLSINARHIIISPNIASEVRWSNNQTLEITWKETIQPSQKININLKSVPTKKGAIQFTGAAQGPFSIQTPPLLVESVALERGRSHPTVHISWNYPFNIKKISRQMLIDHVTDNHVNGLPTGKIAQFTPTSGTSKIHSIELKDRSLWRGHLRIEFPESIILDNKAFDIGKLPRIKIGKTSPLKITSSNTTETGSTFSISINCRAQREFGSYYEKRNCKLDNDAKDFIMVDPEVDFAIISHSDHFQLVGAFKPATRYRLHFLPGLKSRDATLFKPAKKSIRTANLSRSFRFTGKARYLPQKTAPVLIYESTNIDKIKIKVRRILPQNIVFWLTQKTEDAAENLSEFVFDEEIRIPHQKNQSKIGKISLAKSQLSKGVFAVQVVDEKYNTLDRAIFVKTDIAAVVKQDQDDIVIWTRSLSSMAMKGFVNVEAFGFANQKLGSCNTGLFNGECRLKGIMRQPTKPFALILKSANDISYLKFNDLQIDDQRVHAGSRSYPNPKNPVTGYVYPSRGVYRPGESVNLASVLQTSTYQAADRTPFMWKVQNARGKVVKEISSKSDTFGMASLAMNLPNSAPTGRWQVELLMGKEVVGNGEFMVEDFVPERIALTVLAKQQRTQKDHAKFDIDAKYLFGPPVARGSFKVNCSIQPAWDTIPGRKDFKTGSHKRKKFLAVNLEALSGKLDDEGLGSAKCDFANYRDSFPSVMAITAKVEVAEAGSGRVTYKTAATLASRSKYMIGLKDLDSNKKQISIEGRIFDLKGDEANTYQGALEVSIFQLQKHWIYGFDDQFGYHRWHSEEVLVKEGTTRKMQVNGGKFTIALPPSRQYGGYLIRAEDQEGKLTADIELSLGYRWYWWDYHNENDDQDRFRTPKPKAPDQIRLTLSRNEATQGEQLDLEFDAPFAGFGLLTTETNRIESSQWIEVKQGPQGFKVRVPKRLPNAYFSLLILKNPNEKGRFIPARAWGATTVKISPSKYDLHPTLSAPDRVRPGEKFTVKLSTKDSKPASFTIAVVDEGILQLTGFNSPDPLQYFFEPRRLEVKTYDTVGWAFSDPLPSRKATGGGGNGPEGANNGRVSPIRVVSLWQGLAKTDEHGQASVSFTIPPFQGTVRVMAVASGTDAVGAVQKKIQVRDPLVVQSTLPRFFSIDDRVEIPVRVTNLTGQAREVRVRVDSSEHLSIKTKPKKVKILKGKSHKLVFHGEVKSLSGIAKVDVIAKAGKIFTTVEPFTIPVIPQTPMTISEMTVPYAAQIDLKALIPSHVIADGAKLELSVSNAPYLSALNQFAHLIRYPYGCIEQTTSSTFPLLVLGNMIEWIDSEKSEEDVTNMVDHGVDRILSMQTASGGFGYWPGDSTPNFWGTVYATHMLLTAKEKGYAVAPSSIASALSYLEVGIESSIKPSHDKFRTLPYALYVLAKGGKVKKGRIIRLAKDLPDWEFQQLENQFLVLASLYKVGDDRIVQKFLTNKTLMKPAAVAPNQHRGTFWSAFRTDAMRLALAEEIWPGDSRWEKAANRVARYIRGKTYLTTQERNWALLGLGQRLSGLKFDPVGKVALQYQNKPIPANPLKDGTPTWTIAEFDPKNSKINFSKSGPGQPFVYAKVSAHAKEFQLPENKEPLIKIERFYHSLKGDLIKGKVNQGQLVVVEVKIQNLTGQKLENAAIVDRLPAGFEIENARLGRGQTITWVDQNSVWRPDYVDIRDDQIQMFGDINSDHQFYYVARAVTTGDFVAPPAMAEQMYDPERVAYSDYERIKVVGE